MSRKTFKNVVIAWQMSQMSGAPQEGPSSCRGLSATVTAHSNCGKVEVFGLCSRLQTGALRMNDKKSLEKRPAASKKQAVTKKKLAGPVAGEKPKRRSSPASEPLTSTNRPKVVPVVGIDSIANLTRYALQEGITEL
jgi:hypothetical protein